ncbi:unnamed protein product [Zymoseptoria tritici ST99CH_1E4]|uniref:Myb-like domain-containing protein n=1 Tax=Zymoseptoria tritici ST99CH_1E4 TaxID=1276532 RepID=A0A2H1G492_ZYMTR|nr:unnamed protein product [Zymoseptoria tritici ST99CH_1E4]
MVFHWNTVADEALTAAIAAQMLYGISWDDVVADMRRAGLNTTVHGARSRFNRMQAHTTARVAANPVTGPAQPTQPGLITQPPPNVPTQVTKKRKRAKLAGKLAQKKQRKTSANKKTAIKGDHEEEEEEDEEFVEPADSEPGHGGDKVQKDEDDDDQNEGPGQGKGFGHGAVASGIAV